MSDPITIEVTRGDLTESRHQVHAIVMDADGKTIETYGDTQSPVYPRSSLKPLQAIPLIESGAADALGVTDQEIALACASHNGQTRHVEQVAAWLSRLGFSEDDLECGSHWPYQKEDEHSLVQNGQTPCPIHNNCSGKHTGMLTIAKYLDQGIEGYTKFTHPVQQQIFQTLSDMSGIDLTGGPYGIDGCSAPNPALSLDNLARAYSRFIKPDALSFTRGAACQRIMQAMRDHPEMIAGKNRLCTAIMQETKGEVLAKTGAEGNYIALAPDKGLVICVKVADGATRAAHVAIGALLEKHDLLDQATRHNLESYFHPVLKNWREIETGVIRATTDR